MTQNGWYRASDGNWYFAHDPRPYAAPPVPDGRGGWCPPVPLQAVAAPAPPPGRTLTAVLSGAVAVLVLIVLVAGMAGSGDDETTPAAAPLPLVATTAPPERVEPVRTTTPPATRSPRPAPATTKPPVRKTVRPAPRVTTPAPVRTTVAAPRTDPHFGTCKEAIANGYGPYYAGQDEEYDWYTDRDSDGIVCER